MKSPNKTSWTPDQLSRLRELGESGASPLRIAAALKRNLQSVKQKAREIGVEIRSTREIRAKMREADRELGK